MSTRRPLFLLSLALAAACRALQARGNSAGAAANSSSASSSQPATGPLGAAQMQELRRSDLPGQELEPGNSRAFAALEPRRDNGASRHACS